MKPDEAFWSLLRSCDTPTILNSIEVVQGKRGYNNYTHETMLCADASLPPMAGYARTARIKASAPAETSSEETREHRMEYYRYISEGDRPAVVVIEDTDWPNCIGAYWGEVNTTVHSAFGLSGVVTNSVMRDLDDLAPGFQVLAGSIKPSHGFVHIVDYGKPVNVMNMLVNPDDIIHADKHGALVIPAEIVAELPKAITRMRDAESLILSPAREPDFTFEKFEKAWSEFEKART